MKGRTPILIAVFTGAIGIGLLVYVSIEASARQYVRVANLAEAPSAYDGNRIKLSGEVVKNSATFNEETLKLRFEVTDVEGEKSDKKELKDARTTIRYQGPKPDAFKEGGVVIVKGIYHKDGNWIETSTLQAKCPSRYKKKEADQHPESTSNSETAP